MAAPYEDQKMQENGDVYSREYAHNYIEAA
jgi:hypothetical protein